MSRQFIVRVQEAPTNHNRPYSLRCNSIKEVVEEINVPRRGVHWVKEIVDGEELLHRGKVWKESGEIVESCYFCEETQLFHESEELKAAMVPRKVILA